MLTEHNIRQGLLDRDENSLSYIIDHYGQALHGIAFGIVGGRVEIVQEVLQKTFLKIWNNIEKYDQEKSTLFTWMARITRNTAIDTRRSKSFRSDQTSELQDSNVYNVEETIDMENKLDASKLLKGLDEKYSFILKKIYLEGHSHQSLSEEYNIPLGTVKTRLKKGIEILRSNLNSEKKTFIGIFVLLVLLLLIFI